jgi:maleate cis-trans isomerase
MLFVLRYGCCSGIVIQGDSEEELPERLLAAISFTKLDLEVRTKL